MGEVGVSQLPRPEGLIETDQVLDIGAGLRPMGWYKPRSHICVEPYGPYADRLQAADYEVIRMPALPALLSLLQRPRFIRAIYLLDVIEHMVRPEAEAVLDAAVELAPRQIIVATPNGFSPQEGDAWGLGGEYWQRHRSGWKPEDFPGWQISFYDNGANGGFTALRNFD